MPEDYDIKIFEMVYNKFPNASIKFIRKEALRIQYAVQKNRMIMKQISEKGGANPKSEQEILESLLTQIQPETDDEKDEQKEAKEIREEKEIKESVEQERVVKDYTKIENWLIQDPELIRTSIHDDYIICCVCGAKLKTLGVHVRSHNLDTKEYIRISGLPKDTKLLCHKYYHDVFERMKKVRQESSR